MTQIGKKMGIKSNAATGNEASAPLKSRPRTGRPSKQTFDEMTIRILDVASDLFASQGYVATSMEKVAAACNAGKDTIYRRFPSKEALFRDVVLHVRSKALAQLSKAIPPSGAPLKRLESAARWFLAAHLEPAQIALKRIALSEAGVFNQSLIESLGPDPTVEILSSLVKECQNTGLFHLINSTFVAEQLIYAVTIKPIMFTQLGSKIFRKKEAQDVYFEQAWGMFLHGIHVGQGRNNV